MSDPKDDCTCGAHLTSDPVSPDAKRVLLYLYHCEKAGTLPVVSNLDLTPEALQKAIAELIERGFIE